MSVDTSATSFFGIYWTYKDHSTCPEVLAEIDENAPTGRNPDESVIEACELLTENGVSVRRYGNSFTGNVYPYLYINESVTYTEGCADIKIPAYGTDWKKRVLRVCKGLGIDGAKSIPSWSVSSSIS